MATIAPENVRSTLAKHMLADGMDPVIDLEKSHGSWIVDVRDGREYLDLFSMFASMSIGYNHPHLLENKEKLLTAALNKPTNSDIYTTQMAEFCDTLDRVVQPDYLPYSFFIEGGGLAVENALKAAFDWKVRKNLQDGYGPLGSKIIHFRECFHGRTGYTLSLTDSNDIRKTKYFPKFDWPRISNPKLTFPLTDGSLAQVENLETQALGEIQDAISNHIRDIAAIIIEPIQGEGGDNHFRPEFMLALREIADTEDILLIYDEVQTGVGITGKMWAHEHLGEKGRPDLISFGKKTQVCGIFAGERLNEVDQNVFIESSRINSTWGGNLVDMVRFRLYMEVIEKENLVEKVAEMGEYLLLKLKDLGSEFSGLVTNERGQGLFCAFDLPSSENRNRFLELAEVKGVLILGCGGKTVRFRPHLTILKAEIDLGIDILRQVLKQL